MSFNIIPRVGVMFPIEAITIVVDEIEVIELIFILKVPSDCLSRPQGMIGSTGNPCRDRYRNGGTQQ